MVVGALLLIGGFTLFTGTLVAVGAIMPTAKEAGQIFGLMMALIFVPFYAVTLVVSDPHAFIVQIFFLLPLLRPGHRNASKRVRVPQLTRIHDCHRRTLRLGIIVLQVAVRLFRYGSIEYSKKVSLKTVFARQR